MIFKKVPFDIFKFSTQQSFSYSMNKNLQNQVVFLDLT
jgi:hypothetical protein